MNCDVLLAASKFVSSTHKSASKIESSLDLSGLRMQVLDGVDCAASFPAVAAAPCAPGSFVELRSKKGATLIPANGLQASNGWRLQARCEAGGIALRAARIRGGASVPATWQAALALSDEAKRQVFFQDEAGGRAAGTTRLLFYDWSHPKGNLVPGGASGLCSHLWGTIPGGDCAGPNQFVKSINFTNRSVVCGTVPACTNTQQLHFDGTSFSCLNTLQDQINAVGTTLNQVNTRVSGISADCLTVGARKSINALKAASCPVTHTVTGCVMTTRGGHYDSDIWFAGNGCAMDDDEYDDDATLEVRCCRVSVPP